MKLHGKKVSISKQHYPHSLISDLKEHLESFPKPNIENKSSSKFKNIFGLIMLAACLLTLTVLAYNAFKYAKHPTTIEEIPLISADHTAIKIIPSDPGGQQVLNQDKLVYNNLLDPNLKITKNHTHKIEDDSVNTDVHLRAPKQSERNKHKLESKQITKTDAIEDSQKNLAHQDQGESQDTLNITKNSSTEATKATSDKNLDKEESSKPTQPKDNTKPNNKIKTPFDVL
ncbi:MAG: hypothetical protein K0R73_1388 [Candidatus Midichloriaceae bacterium]|jgi:hypothetical protein|nr:hypothetical protein [Candidatus Midichloriaceae bacterium]